MVYSFFVVLPTYTESTYFASFAGWFGGSLVGGEVYYNGHWSNSFLVTIGFYVFCDNLSIVVFNGKASSLFLNNAIDTIC
jgi:hypothetical protein